MENKPIFLNGLNGIRTIAALGVLLSHINLSLREFKMFNISLFGFDKNGNQDSWSLGEHGVTMFFVLSGFLITYLLLKEYDKTSFINIGKFYMRRILRIWPLYFLYISMTLIILWKYIVPDLNLVYYLTFFANVPFIKSQSYLAMNHLWSISVEEQFYLFWPVLFLFFVRRNFVVCVLSVIIVLSVARVFIWYVSPFSLMALFSVVNRFDCMLIGALGAFLVHRNNKIIDILNNRLLQISCWIIVLLLVVNKFIFFNSIIEIFVIEVVTLIIIIGQIKIKNRIVNLENPLFSYIGKLSFGLYVYHPLFIVGFYKFIDFHFFSNELLNVVIIFLSVLVSSLIMAHVSYYYFEQKFLNMKTRYSVVESSNIKV
ncbi:acyltransferase family protein [Sphingobacterium sp. GVS05A]|uniref:acyltransferase family protein n=1 Tax=Sphingobacterium sp. GVS05A TaxID=2862679 RepID=UPI001CBFD601|nr:acyltransferase [Sphingobacterium sp. GVS05A]